MSSAVKIFEEQDSGKKKRVVENPMALKSLLVHYNNSQYSYDSRMFLIGVANNIGIQVMIGYLTQLATLFNRNYHMAIIMVFL
jgi:hypothetical protein